MIKKYFSLLFTILISSQVFSQHKNAGEVIDKMIKACDNLMSSSFVLKSTERLEDGDLHESEVIVKLQRNSLKIYIYCINPNPGAEGLWRIGELNNHVLVNPNGFPFFNLKLNTHNPLLRKGQHHTIEEMGFDYISNVFKYYLEKSREELVKKFSVQDEAQFDGRNCIQLVYENQSFYHSVYTASFGESLTSIAQGNFVSDYMLLCLNTEVKGYDKVKPGQAIKLPVTYGKKIILYLDEHTFLPLVQMIYDEKGLYEKYEFKSFILNPKFGEEDFSPKNPKYGF
ncbi:MAG: DUF1571 domain-containing protein [Bacteroidia bacterium]|nr:DUF1571 domain-containing protein [Bacteroidia bacterium]